MARDRARDAATAIARAAALRLGYRTVPRSFYSPIPEPGELPEEIWTQPSQMAGIDLRVEEQLRFLEHDLAPYLREFNPPRLASASTTEFYLENGSYESVDAETLYAIVRQAKPSRMIEVGSGFSTLVAARACVANAADGVPTELIAVEPYPRAFLEHRVEGLARLERRRATELPIEFFDALDSGDILFVDTTHVVKTGGEVNRIVLDVLPRLRGGVLVHFHDVFLPWEYPREWLEQLDYFWTEQYLLQAFLTMNDEFEVVFAAHHLGRTYPERVAASIPSFRPGCGGAFWLRRKL
jgi:predicted O-methyltransferase YrrM